MKQILFALTALFLITGCSQREHTTSITVKEKDGLINDDGDVLIKPVYKKVFHLDNPTANDYSHPHYINLHWIHLNGSKFAIVKNIDNKYGIIDKDGELKLKVMFDSVGNFFNGFAKVEVNGKFGLINEDFDIVVKPIYDGIRDVIDGSIIVKNYSKNDKTQYGCINSSNLDLVLPLDYEMIYISSEDRMRTIKEGKWGFIDTKCDVIAENIYEYADDFSNGAARVKKDNLWTYIDSDGDELERRTFEDSTNFDF